VHINNYWKDKVAEWIKGSVAGGIILQASHGVWREVPATPTRAWQIPTKTKQLMAIVAGLHDK